MKAQDRQRSLVVWPGPVVVYAAAFTIHPFLALLLGRAQVDKRKLDVLVHGQFVDQVEALEHEADVILAQVGPLPLGVAGHSRTRPDPRPW